MDNFDWVQEYPGGITVCDRHGIIVYANARSQATFAPGGAPLVGRNVLDCHPEPAQSKLAGMLASGQPNSYTIEKNGIRKLIHQTPWYKDGVYAGFVELSIEIPPTMPHYVRRPRTEA